MDSKSTALVGVVKVVNAGIMSSLGAYLSQKGVSCAAIGLSTAQAFVDALADFLGEHLTQNPIQESLSDEFFADLKRHVDLLIAKTSEAQGEANRALCRAVTPVEAAILIEQFREHATRSAQEERRRFLAAAAAATFRPDIDTEMKSRAERAIAILEPGDIALLRAFEKTVESAQRGGGWDEIRIFWDDQSVVNQTALIQSGCITIENKFEPGTGSTGGPGIYRPPRFRKDPLETPLGAAVRRLLETYCPA